jgi:hypothetical protein
MQYEIVNRHGRTLAYTDRRHLAVNLAHRIGGRAFILTFGERHPIADR